MRCLGIESTAHTFGVGIADDDGIAEHAKAMYEPAEGGIHPREAAEHHYAHALETLNNALDAAGTDMEAVDGISFSRGPGMPPSLDVGAVVARALAAKHDLPLYGVNHILGHVEVGRLETGADDPVALFVSGGNSQVLAYAGGRYRVFGETLDIAIGNALDKLARTMDIPHPGGPRIEELAAQGDELLELSYTVKGMDFSFSGILTEAQRRYEEGASAEDVCFAFQEHTYAMLVEATERAMAHLGKEEVLLTGGVAANDRLRSMLTAMAEDRGAAAYVVPHEYAMDNGAMIAWLGVLAAKHRDPDPLRETAIDPDWRPEEVSVPWR